MDSDDPFYNPDDSDKTVIRPTPGGVRPASGAAQTPPAQPTHATPSTQPASNTAEPVSAAASTASFGATRTGTNIITDAAAQLLALVGRLKSTTQHNDIAALHRQVVQAIQSFENNARDLGASPENLLVSRYGLCAAIDETVLNTPWGSSSVWSSHSMLSTFHKETGGGEKFFLILDRLRQEPAKNIDLIELYSIILALGFEGKYRIQANGRSFLDNLRDELFNTIRQQRGEYERELSPSWRGLQAKFNTLSQQVPLWVIGALTGVVMLTVYLGFNFVLLSNAGPSLEKFESISQTSTQRESQ
jgi:type VI secretion system protein ImpK